MRTESNNGRDAQSRIRVTGIEEFLVRDNRGEFVTNNVKRYVWSMFLMEGM